MKIAFEPSEALKALFLAACFGSCQVACYARSTLELEVTDAGEQADSDSDADPTDSMPFSTDTSDTPGGDTATELETETDTAVHLMPDTEGWLDKTANGLGLQGAWYTYGGVGAVYTPAGDQQIFNDGIICFSGEAPAIGDEDGDAMPDFTTQYGAAIAFDTCSRGGPVPLTPTTRYPLGECPFNGELANQLGGIAVTFREGGTISSGELRIVFNEGDDMPNSYVFVDPGEVSAGHTVNAHFSDALTHWDTSMKPEGTIPFQIIAIQFQVPTNPHVAVSWDFCITDITAILK